MMAKHSCILNKLLCCHMNHSTFSGLISFRPPICNRKNYQYWLIYYSQTQQTFSNIINKCYTFRYHHRTL